MADGEIMCELLPDVIVGTRSMRPQEGVVLGKMRHSGTVVKVPFWDRLASAADCGRMTGKPEVNRSQADLYALVVTDRLLTRTRLPVTNPANLPEARFWIVSAFADNSPGQ
jgi:hypothetical protein